MDAVLQQLGQIPGVVGTVIYGREGLVEASRFPAVFEQTTVAQVASSLAQDAYLEEWLKGPAACLDLRFNEGRVVVRPLPGGWLLVLCTPQVNAQLLNLSLTQGLRRLQRDGVRPSVPPTAAPVRASAPTPDPTEVLRGRLVAVAEAGLGQYAPQAVELLARASSIGGLAEAAGEVEKMTRLFVSRKKADELAQKLRAVFEKGGTK